MHGWFRSGVGYAIDPCKVVLAPVHEGDRHPPPGALTYGRTGHGAGRIVFPGDGRVAGNDILRSDCNDVVDTGFFGTGWGAKCAGGTRPCPVFTLLTFR